MIRVNNLSVSCATLSEKSLSLTCRDVCNQAKALCVCDVNISPAEKHLFITLLKVLQRGQWRAAGSKRNLLGWQDGQAGSHHVSVKMSPTVCAHRKFYPGLWKALEVTEDSQWSSSRNGSSCTPFHPRTSLSPATGPSQRKCDLFTDLFMLSCFHKLFCIGVPGTKGAGGQILQGQNVWQGWIFQPWSEESCQCK